MIPRRVLLKGIIHGPKGRTTQARVTKASTGKGRTEVGTSTDDRELDCIF